MLIHYAYVGQYVNKLIEIVNTYMNIEHHFCISSYGFKILNAIVLILFQNFLINNLLRSKYQFHMSISNIQFIMSQKLCLMIVKFCATNIYL